MATSIRLDSRGDINKAQVLIPLATGNLMWIFKELQRTSPLLKEMSYSWSFSDGSTIQIYGSKWGLDPYYQVDIFSPLSHEESEEEETYASILLFIPVTYQYTIFEDLPMLKHVPHEHRYLLSFSGGGVDIAPTKEGPEINYAGGLFNTIQFNAKGKSPIAYLASIMSIIDDAELGMIDWTNIAEIDRHMKWGDFITITRLGCCHGASASIGRTTKELYADIHSRHDLLYSEDLKVIGDNLNFEIISLDVDSLAGIRESVFGVREFNSYQIKYKDLDGIKRLGTFIGADMPTTIEHRIGYWNEAWEYFVPIMVLSDKAALYRKVRRESNGVLCPDVTYKEELKVGDEIIAEGTYNSSTHINGLMVIGADVVHRNSEESYGLNMGTWTEDIVFSVTGDPGFTITSSGSLSANSTACGDGVVSASVPHCDAAPKIIHGDCYGMTLAISGSDTALAPVAPETETTQQFSASACCPSNSDITWSVSGTGVSIDQTGLVTLDITACGSFSVTALCANCGLTATYWVRVSNNGGWHTINYCNVTSTNSGTAVGGGPPCTNLPATYAYYSGQYRGVIIGPFPANKEVKWTNISVGTGCTASPGSLFYNNFWEGLGTYAYDYDSCAVTADNAMRGNNYAAQQWIC